MAYRWCSLRLLNRGLHVGDFLTSSAIITSGNNFSKVALFAKFVKLHFVSKSVFYRIQHCYAVPAVEQYWLKDQAALIDDFRGKDVIVLGMLIAVACGL